MALSFDDCAYSKMVAAIFENIPINGQFLELCFFHSNSKPTWFLLCIILNCSKRGKSRDGAIRNTAEDLRQV